MQRYVKHKMPSIVTDVPELSMGWVDPWVGLGPLQKKY